MYGSTLAVTIPPGQPSPGICILFIIKLHTPPVIQKKTIPHPGTTMTSNCNFACRPKLKRQIFHKQSLIFQHFNQAGVSFGRKVGARKLKNGAGDGANIHVFNIKPCVFPATFLDAILPNCLACCRLGTKPLAYRVFLFPAPTPGTKQSTQFPTPGLCWVTLHGDCPGGWSQQELNHAL